MRKRIQLLAWVLPLGLFMGCASTSSPPVDSRPITQVSTPTSSSPDVAPVSTSGPPTDRAAIESSNKQIYDAQHGMSSPTPAATVPTTGIPQ